METQNLGALPQTSQTTAFDPRGAGWKGIILPPLGERILSGRRSRGFRGINAGKRRARIYSTVPLTMWAARVV